MNVDNMLRLADELESLPDYRFNIRFWFSSADLKPLDDGTISVQYSPIDHKEDGRIFIKKSECGTAACVAGWAMVLAGDGVAVSKNLVYSQYAASGAVTIAREFLGLTHYEADQLFYWDEFSIYNKYSEELGLKKDRWEEIDPSSITASDVAAALRLLVNGTFKFTEEDYSNEYR